MSLVGSRSDPPAQVAQSATAPQEVTEWTRCQRQKFDTPAPLIGHGVGSVGEPTVEQQPRHGTGVHPGNGIEPVSGPETRSGQTVSHTQIDSVEKSGLPFESPGLEQTQRREGAQGKASGGSRKAKQDPDRPLRDAIKTAVEDMFGITISVRERRSLLIRLRRDATFSRENVDLGNIRQKVEDTYKDWEFKDSERNLLETSRLGVEEGVLYRNVDLKITEDTIVKDLRDVEGATLALIETDTANTVFEVTYPEANGERFVSAFKPLNDVTGSQILREKPGDYSGIPLKSPNIAMRNLAACALARALEFDVAPRTEVACHKVNKKKRLGIETAWAPGVQAHKCKAEVFERGEIRRETMKLQLFDHLTGQADRHGGNYFIDQTNKTVIGIDNDLCFGKKIEHPDKLVRRGNLDVLRKKIFNGVHMPPIVDTQMAKAIDSLTNEKLAEILKDKLNPEEVAAAQERLTALKAHVLELTKADMVIDPQDWAGEKASHALNQKHSETGYYQSYIHRDATRSSKRERRQADNKENNNMNVQ